MKHPYQPGCSCRRCTAEQARRQTQAAEARTTPAVMADWRSSRQGSRRRAAEAYWDAFESGRPMSSDDY